MPPRYDWNADPNHYCDERERGHRPDNRCYHCGFRFVGAKYAAFCVICDRIMSMGDNDTVMTTGDPKNPKHVSRLEWVSTRIRIPDGLNEEEYRKRMEIPDVRVAGFFKASDLV